MVQIGKAIIDPIRNAAFAAIPPLFGVLGAPLASPARMVIFKNLTPSTVEVSLDGTNIHSRLIANSSSSWSLDSLNITDMDFVLPTGTQFYIRFIGAPPISGNFWIEIGRAATV